MYTRSFYKNQEICVWSWLFFNFHEFLASLILLNRPVGRAVTRCLWSGRSEVQISGRSNRARCYQRLATAATFLRKELCCPGAMTRRWAAQTPHTLWRNTASIMKDFIWLILFLNFEKKWGSRFNEFVFIKQEFCFCKIKLKNIKWIGEFVVDGVTKKIYEFKAKYY